ncbi:MAG: cyclic nucleotide-binding domain-containing protein [Candidatus Aminicenantes bacterium]|nr:cyclic nucleotide-binding domain-containing protein [Candidatus Aminicenantes bacterium]
MDALKKFISKYSAGDVIYKKGDIQTDFFIINKGKVQLKNDGHDRILVTLAKGDFFGEESLNNEQNAIYTVEVIEDSFLIKIPYVALTEMLKQTPDIALKILKKLSEKHIRIQTVLMEMAESRQGAKPKAGGGETKKEDATSEKIGGEVKAYLIIQRSNRLVQLTKTQTFLGRRDYTTGFVPDIDLTDEDEEKYISRKHAKIQYKDGKFYLSEEPGAINGTFLNGNKLQTGVKHELHAEDEITLCHLNIVFKV